MAAQIVMEVPNRLYPVVQDLSDMEYKGLYCGHESGCDDDQRCFSLSNLPLLQKNFFGAVDHNEQTKGLNQNGTIQRRHPSDYTFDTLATSLMDTCDSLTVCTNDVLAEEQVNVRKFEDYYVLTRQLFRCQYSTVWECIHRENGCRYCVKTMDRTKENMDEVERIKSLNHKGIVSFVDLLVEGSTLHLITELVPGGNLLSRIYTQESTLSEEQARVVARSLVEGVNYLHSENMYHNDLQPENLLLTVDDTIKIADFGCANTYGYGNRAYTAPEVVKGQPSTQGDMWSIGCVLYFCLSGAPPSLSRDRRPNYSFRESNWDHVSRAAKQFISCLLHADPQIRLTAHEALEHPWLREYTELDRSVRKQRRTLLKKLSRALTLCFKREKREASRASATPFDANSSPLDTSSFDSAKPSRQKRRSKSACLLKASPIGEEA